MHLGRSSASVVALVCCVLVAVGCGSSGGSERLTKEEYLQEFRSIGDELQGTFDEVEAGFDTTSLASVSDQTVELADVFDELGTRVDGLAPPQEVQAAHDHLVHGLREFAASLRAVADKIAATPAAELEDALAELGVAGEFDPAKFPAAARIQEAVKEFRAKGYELDEANEGYATEGPGDPGAGKAVFESAGCSGCHALADAGAAGSIGPNLDSSLPPYGKVVERVTNGQGIMPPFEGRLTEQQIQDVAAYISSVAGG